MAKKMSVEEILAAARAEKAKGGGAPAGGSEGAEAEVRDQRSEVSEEAAPSQAPASVGGKVAPGGKGMSVAEILAAAKAKPGAAAAKPTAAKVAPAAKPAAASAAKAAAPKPAAAKADGGAGAAPKDTASI